jgi:hypothetical protein
VASNEDHARLDELPSGSHRLIPATVLIDQNRTDRLPKDTSRRVKIVDRHLSATLDLLPEPGIVAGVFCAAVPIRISASAAEGPNAARIAANPPPRSQGPSSPCPAADRPFLWIWFAVPSLISGVPRRSICSTIRWIGRG